MSILFKSGLLICLCGLFACSTSSDTDTQDFTVTVRLAAEPDNLNPTRSRTSSATQIENMIIYPLAEYDPFTLELTPLLVVDRAEVDTLEAGPFAGGLAFHYEIRPEAEWSDGSPVTGHDYAFTVKAVLNPEVAAAAWRGYLSFIKNVEVDPANPKKFTVYVPEPYMLAEVVTCNFNILPRHVYDSTGILDDIPFDVLSDPEAAASAAESDERLSRFAIQFASPEFNRDIIEGSGPYRLVEWVTGEHIILEKKEKWWGDKLKKPPAMLRAYPTRIVYRIIPDETAALSALKDGSVDVVSEITAANFTAMRDDPEWKDRFHYHTPSLIRHNCITLNTRHPILQDVNVRRALAKSIDYDAIINTLLLGMATRTTGPFHSSKPYYNADLLPDSYNVDEARNILMDAGWDDSDQDGVVDKQINGEHTELNLDIIVTQRLEGQQLALLFKESAARAGIEIDIITMDNSGLSQAIRTGEFELLPISISSSPSVDDPYARWHSDNNRPGGGNRSGFSDEEADEIIEEIRSTSDEQEQIALFKELQEILYEEKPELFLYIPTERIIVNDRIEMTPSSRRPGYFENLFRLQEM